MAGKNTFHKGFEKLEKQVGDGVLRGELVFNQPYAAKQHNDLSYDHPRGGGAGYVTKPQMRFWRRWYEMLAKDVLRGSLNRAMQDVVDEWAERASSEAPVESTQLRKSANPRVYDDKVEVYNKPPKAPREPDYRRTGRAGWQWNRGRGRKPGRD
jgi:hypothetical protein